MTTFDAYYPDGSPRPLVGHWKPPLHETRCVDCRQPFGRGSAAHHPDGKPCSDYVRHGISSNQQFVIPEYALDRFRCWSESPATPIYEGAAPPFDTPPQED